MKLIWSWLGVLLMVRGTLCQTENLLELATTLGLSSLVQEISDKGLNDTLTGPGPITLMGPTDAAFSRLPGYLENNDTSMLEILNFHIHRGFLESVGMTDELTVVTDISGGYSFRCNVYTGVISTNGGRLTNSDNLATNGILHVIDEVMLPTRQTLPELTSTTPFLFTLNQAIIDTGLTGELEADPITGLGPDDQAFADLGPPINDTDVLRNILRYHVIADTLYTAGLQDGQTFTTLQGDLVTVSINGSGDFFINDAHIYIPNTATTNGAAHILDKVLIPPSFNLVEQLHKDNSFTSLIKALESADLLQLLSGEDPFTLFAPTDAAFDRLDNFDGLDGTHISTIMKSHIVEGRVYSVGLHNGQEIHSMETGKSIHVAVHKGVVTLDTGHAEAVQLIGKDKTVTNGVIHVIDHVLIPTTLQGQMVHN